MRVQLGIAFMGLASLRCGGPAFAIGSSDASTDTASVLDARIGDADADAKVTPPADATKPDGPGIVMGGDGAACPSVTASGSQVVTLTTDPNRPGPIAVGTKNLYWSDIESNTIVMAPKASVCAGTVLAMNQSWVQDLFATADDLHLYWSVSDSNASPPPATALQCLAMEYDFAATTPVATCLGRSGTYASQRMAFSPGTVSSPSAYVAILSQASIVTNNPSVGYFQLGRADPFAFTGAAGQGQAIGMSGNASEILVADGSHVDGFGFTLGSPPVMLQTPCNTPMCGTGTIVDMVVDATAGDVYWAAVTGTQSSEVHGLAFSPPGQPLLWTADVPGLAVRMTRGKSNVFVAYKVPGSPVTTGAIVAIDATSGLPTATFSFDSAPIGITVDLNNLYWTCADGTIRTVGVP